MSECSESNTLVFRKKPQDFAATAEVAACYFEINGKFLFVKRAIGKTEGGKWGVPAGTIEANQGSLEAACRETFEKSQIILNDEQLTFVGKLFVRKPDVEYIYHMYHLKLDYMPSIELNDEHDEHRWLTADEAKNFPIISGGLETLYHFKALSNKPKLARKPFYFIRHGETDVNSNPHLKRVDYDLPLNQRGIEQALQARRIIENVSFKSVCFSPIQRAVETKDIIVSTLKIDHEEVEDLSECKAHIWTKMVLLEEGKGFHVCDEVEGFLGRVVRGLDFVLQKEPNTLVVAHGGIHWALCYNLSIESHPWKIGNCQLVHFQPIGEQGWKAKVITSSSKDVI